tara:strand:- start:102 stop:1382 length:1281 start_codon:yes stop_codon:yes gene_type:complete
MAILKKKYIDKDVIQAAKDRIKYLFEVYDKVVVNFSGGKDSNAMLYIALEAARETGNLPLEAVYVDHEVEGNGTLDLLDEVSKMEDVDFKRYAVPFKLRNAASLYAPEWIPWHPEEEQLWLREKPEGAITEVTGYEFKYDKDYEHPLGLPFKALGVKNCISFQNILDTHIADYKRKGVNAIALVGIRAEESLARYTIMSRKKTECYISSNAPTAYPIYDMRATDVWKYIRETGLPYNKEYDLMNKTEYFNKLNKQRVGSIFAEESLRGLHQWREMYGEKWHKILERAEGVKTAWRYNNDSIYTGTKITKEDSVSFQDYTKALIGKMSPETKTLVKKTLKKVIVWHKNQTEYPISDKELDACPLTGVSWEFLARIAIRGDTKERNLQRVPQLSQKARARAKLTRDQAVDKYGSLEYKKRYYGKKKNA